MTQKDYVLVAKALASIHRNTGFTYAWDRSFVFDALCKAFKEDNPNFRRDRFIAQFTKESSL